MRNGDGWTMRTRRSDAEFLKAAAERELLCVGKPDRAAFAVMGADGAVNVLYAKEMKADPENAATGAAAGRRRLLRPVTRTKTYTRTACGSPGFSFMQASGKIFAFSLPPRSGRAYKKMSVLKQALQHKDNNTHNAGGNIEWVRTRWN